MKQNVKIWSEVELFVEPRKACLSSYHWPKGEPEMTEFESAFLCGLIRERKPKKIVEIGVAGGGTTGVILKCLEFLGVSSEVEVFSMDLAETFYRQKDKRTGYLADDIINSRSDFHHKFLLGKLLPEVVDEIGDNIDFVILDTVHSMPGEVLDFLAIYPYLNSNACVVLHDFSSNISGQNPLAFATQLVFSSVAATKIIKQDDSRPYRYPNIGAFVVNDTTKENIGFVLNSLIITWRYIMSEKWFDIYFNHYSKHYGLEFANLFSNIYHIQKEKSKGLLWNSRLFKVISSLHKSFRKILKSC